MANFGEVLDTLRRDGEAWSVTIPRTWSNGRTVFGGLQVALSVRANVARRAVHSGHHARVPAAPAAAVSRRTVAVLRPR